MHKTAVCWEGRNAASFLMGMLANGRNGSTLSCLQSNQNTSFFIWPKSDSRASWGAFVLPNFEFSRSNTCPIKTDLAEVSLTRDLLGINILSVVLE